MRQIHIIENLDRPKKFDIIKTIFEHNQKRYTEFSNIDYKNFTIDAVGTPELVLGYM